MEWIGIIVGEFMGVLCFGFGVSFGLMICKKNEKKDVKK